MPSYDILLERMRQLVDEYGAADILAAYAEVLDPEKQSESLGNGFYVVNIVKQLSQIEW